MAFCQDSPREALLGTGLPFSPFSSEKKQLPSARRSLYTSGMCYWYGWPACVGLWNSLQAKDRAGDTRGREGAGSQWGPTQSQWGHSQGPVFSDDTVTTHVPRLSGGVLAKSFTATGDQPKIAGTAAGHAGLWRHCPRRQACPKRCVQREAEHSPAVMDGPSPISTLAGALAGVGGVAQGGVGTGAAPLFQGLGDQMLTTPPSTPTEASGAGNGAPCSTGGSVSFDLGLALDWCVPP